jgi:hypothetical protein
VFTFDGSLQSGWATLLTTNVPTGGGSAGQGIGTVPSAFAATLGHDSFNIGECTFLHFAQSMSQCQFSSSAPGVQ